MTPVLTETSPLTLSEQLDAMLLGWLDRHAAGDPRTAGVTAKGVITVAGRGVDELEAFCARWDLTVQRLDRGDGRWAVLVVEGPAPHVRGFTEITSMYRP